MGRIPEEEKEQFKGEEYMSDDQEPMSSKNNES
jgi:hypothetical protein